MLLRLPGQGNRQLTAISVTSTGYRKLHFEFESRFYEYNGYSKTLHSKAVVMNGDVGEKL